MKSARLILIGVLTFLSLACTVFGFEIGPSAVPTEAIDPTVHAVETLLAQPANTGAPLLTAAATPVKPTPSNTPTQAVSPSPSPAACLIGTWKAVNIQDYVIAAIPEDMAKEYRPTYQSTTGEVYVSFFENNLITIQAYDLVLNFDIQAGIFRVGLVVALDGLSSGQYQADGSQVVTSNMTTTGMTASAQALQQNVVSPEQIIAALPLVQAPYNVATYQCNEQSLSLRLSAYPESIPALQFQRVP